MMKIDINKVIILENKEEYVVLDKVNCEDIDYYYIAKINDTKTDIENNYKLIRVLKMIMVIVLLRKLLGKIV